MINKKYITYYCKHCDTLKTMPREEYGLKIKLKPLYCPKCLGMLRKRRKMKEL